MPEEGVDLTANSKLLTSAEIVRIASIFAQHGVEKIRLTGGEPTVRKDLLHIVGQFGPFFDVSFYRCFCVDCSWLKSIQFENSIPAIVISSSENKRLTLYSYWEISVMLMAFYFLYCVKNPYMLSYLGNIFIFIFFQNLWPTYEALPRWR